MSRMCKQHEMCACTCTRVEAGSKIGSTCELNLACISEHIRTLCVFSASDSETHAILLRIMSCISVTLFQQLQAHMQLSAHETSACSTYDNIWFCHLPAPHASR